MDPHIAHFSKLLLEKVSGKTRSKICSKGIFIFLEGAKYLGPWVLNKGVAVLVKSSSNGKEQIVREVEVGEVFAEVPLFKNIEWYPLSARCATACELSLIPAEEAKRVLQQDRDLMWSATRALAGRITEFRDSFFDLTLAQAKQRLLRYLLRRLDGKPNASLGVVRLGINHQDLALLLDLRPESLSRVLKDLETDGKLKRLSRQTFQILLKNMEEKDRQL